VRIPKSFQLVNRTWKVKLVGSKELEKVIKDESDAQEVPAAMRWGVCDIVTATIYLNSDLHADKPREMLEHTFCHELMHAILFANGQIVDHHDEALVDRFGGFLHQIFQTQKGEHA
jgi:hypothetical protein